MDQSDRLGKRGRKRTLRGGRPIVAGRVLARYRRRRPLDPNWRRFPPAEARRVVALYGEEALRAGDPELAWALGLLRRRDESRADDGSSDGPGSRGDYDYADDGGGGDD